MLLTTRGRPAFRRTLTIAAFVLAVGVPPARAQAPEGFAIDPCTIPDLGGGDHWTGVYRRPGVAFFAVVTNLSARPARELSVADGIAGYRTGETLYLRIDIRDGSGRRPPFPVAIHLSAIGGGSVRPAGKTYRCSEMDFFWNGSGDRETRELGIDEIEYIIGNRAAVAGLVPDSTVPGLVEPLWVMITERLRILFGETDPEKDEQHDDGDVEYPVRPERIGSPRTPDPMRRAADRGLILGPSLESDSAPIILQPVRRFVAFRDNFERSHVMVARASSRSKYGTIVPRGERVLLRRLGKTNLFVGSFIVMPDGYSVRFLDGPLVKFEVGTTGELLVELEDASGR